MKKIIFWIHSLIVLTLVLLAAANLFAQSPQKHLLQHKHGVSHGENSWKLVDHQKIKREIVEEHKIKPTEEELFFIFCHKSVSEIRNEFFTLASGQSISETSIGIYQEKLRTLYRQRYPEFVKIRDDYKKQFSLQKTASINSTCNNADFENGNLSGWTRGVGEACISPYPCNVTNFNSPTQHFITNATTVDPYIPGLSTVAPGGYHSLRLENLVNGGDASLARYTFAVTANTSLFTYKYAVVLEDPGDHDDEERPYFKVNMYDENGNNISCGHYSVIAKPPLQNFNLVQIPDPGFGTIDLYYRDWTTVSIPLNNYIGQNVTIEFVVSDCSLGGHLGYAYIDAECARISPDPTQTICGAKTGTLAASEGFQFYNWSGPGIVGPSNTQSITVNKAGNYSVKLTPFADNPCPVTMSVDVFEKCPVDSVLVTFCETVSGKATGVNLNNYATQVTSYNSPPGSIVSWHSAKPASAANLISSVANMTIIDNSYLYVIVALNSSKDTIKVVFDLKPLPGIIFPALPSLCVGNTTHQINGVTPAGGTFSGPNVTAVGILTPSTAGTFTINYTYTDSEGCTNSAQSSVAIKSPAVINAGSDQKLCINGAANNVQLFGTSGHTASFSWTGGSGVYSNNTVHNPVYMPSSGDIAAGTVVFTLTGTAHSPCPNVSDQVMITFAKAAVIDAGVDQVKCSDNASSISLNGMVSNIASLQWSGGTGTFNAANQATTNYTPSPSDMTAGTITVNLAGTAHSPCPNVNDQLTLTFVQAASIEAGKDQVKCSDNAATISLSGIASNVASLEWSGGTGSFSASDQATTIYIPSSSDIAAGSILLTLSAKANQPCANVTDHLKLTYVPAAEVDAGNDQEICASVDKIKLAGAASHTASISWNEGKGTFIPDNTSPTATYKPSKEEVENGKVVLILSGDGNPPCANVSDQMILTIHPMPKVDLNEEYKFCSEDSGGIVIDAGIHQKYEWYPTGDTTRSIAVHHKGIYQITVTSEFNCSSTDETHVREVCPPRLFISNAFSPNQDGTNDNYTVFGEHIGKFEMIIFNRWGEVIFESDDLGRAWDGFYREETMPLGVYPWIITYEGDTEEYKGPYKMEGSVTVLK